MPDVKRCPKCGAQNAVTAEWCTLCLTKFARPTPDAEIGGELAALGGGSAGQRPRVPPGGETISGGNGDELTSIPETTPVPGGNGQETVVEASAPALPEAPPASEAPPAGEAPPVRETPTRETPPAQGSEPPPGPPFVSAPPPPVRDVPVRFLRDGETVRWVCPACETPNDIEASACRICGTVMARLFAPEPIKEKTAVRSPGVAMGLSAALPGLGHHYTGATAAGISRASLYVWTLVIAVLFLLRPPERARGLLRGVGVLFALAAALVWVVSFIEAGRHAEGDHTPLVPPRAVTWFSAGLTMLLFLGLAAAAFSRG